MNQLFYKSISANTASILKSRLFTAPPLQQNISQFNTQKTEISCSPTFHPHYSPRQLPSSSCFFPSSLLCCLHLSTIANVFPQFSNMDLPIYR